LDLTTAGGSKQQGDEAWREEVKMTGYTYAGGRHYTRLAERVLEYATDNSDDGAWDEILCGGWQPEVIAFELERANIGSLPMALAMFHKIGKLLAAA